MVSGVISARSGKGRRELDLTLRFFLENISRDIFTLGYSNVRRNPSQNIKKGVNEIQGNILSFAL